MNNFFEQALDFVLNTEKRVYTNDPTDSGGPTMWGVTQKAYEEYVQRLVPLDDFKALTPDQIKQFYLDVHWKSLRCDQMKKLPVAMCIFDSGVLYGVGTAALFAQKAVSLCGATLKLDGIIGDKSLDFLNAVGTEEFLKAFHGLVLARIDSIIESRPKDEKYRNGWTNRANRLLTLRGVVPSINETA